MLKGAEIKTLLSGLGTKLADRLSITYLETKLSLALNVNAPA